MYILSRRLLCFQPCVGLGAVEYANLVSLCKVVRDDRSRVALFIYLYLVVVGVLSCIKLCIFSVIFCHCQ